MSFLVQLHNIIEVTAEDIRSGKLGNCAACPIALAVNRAIPGAEASVSDDSVFADIPGAGRRWSPMPSQGARFVRAFDRGEPVEPLVLDLRFRFKCWL